MKTLFKKFNDLFANELVVLILGAWIAQGTGVVTLPGEVNGALIAGFTLIIQFYFRKSPPEAQ